MRCSSLFGPPDSIIGHPWKGEAVTLKMSASQGTFQISQCMDGLERVSAFDRRESDRDTDGDLPSAVPAASARLLGTARKGRTSTVRLLISLLVSGLRDPMSTISTDI